MNLQALIARNMDRRYQNVPSIYWPLDVRLAGPTPYAWLKLPGWHYLVYGLGADRDERVVVELGPWCIVRPETEEEAVEREREEAEAAWDDLELNRYIAWYY